MSRRPPIRLCFPILPNRELSLCCMGVWGNPCLKIQQWGSQSSWIKIYWGGVQASWLTFLNFFRWLQGHPQLTTTSVRVLLLPAAQLVIIAKHDPHLPSTSQSLFLWGIFFPMCFYQIYQCSIDLVFMVRFYYMTLGSVRSMLWCVLSLPNVGLSSTAPKLS